MEGGAKADDYAWCEAMVRREDRDRWLTSLFIPEAARRNVLALYAFNLEVARVREVVSEPMLGEIRLQWQRDALEKPDDGDVRANPVAAALLDAIARFDLPIETLIELIDARAFDLYDDPMETVGQLEAYCQATSSNLFRLIAMILTPDEPASGLGAAAHGGIAYALTGLLRAFPWHAARGQLFIPLEILKKHRLERAEIAAGQATPAVRAALADMRTLALEHLEIFLSRIEGLPDRCKPGFLPVALCEPYLRLMEKPGYEPFKAPVELPQWRRQWTLWRAAKNWG
jgi:15-cis-phytoene synthase